MSDHRADKLGEYWDVYNAQKERTGRTHQRGQQLQPGDYHLVTNGLIFNSKGDVLLQQRAFDKLSHPGIWTADTGGAVLVGETSQQALVREVSEELGIAVSADELVFIETLRYTDWIEDWYAIRLPDQPVTFQLQTAEVVAVRWVRFDEALANNTAKGFDDNDLLHTAKARLF